MCGFFNVQRTVPCGETYFVQCRTVYCIVSTYLNRNLYIHILYFHKCVHISGYIHCLYIYISFFSLAFSKQTCFANVEFRDNSLSVRGVWWLRHGSDSSRSQLGLQPGDRGFLGGSSERKSTSTSTISEGGPQKKPNL